jgi:hypothetical protein
MMTYIGPPVPGMPLGIPALAPEMSKRNFVSVTYCVIVEVDGFVAPPESVVILVEYVQPAWACAIALPGAPTKAKAAAIRATDANGRDVLI